VSSIVIAHEWDAPKAPDWITKAQYRRLCAMRWKNRHTTRYRAMTGDDKLLVAWDPGGGTPHPDVPLGRWCFARLCRRAVVDDTDLWGRHATSYEIVPVIWWHLEDDSVEPAVPVGIDDPRIPAKVMNADRWARWRMLGSRPAPNLRIEEANAHRDHLRKKRKEDLHYKIRQRWRQFSRWADDVGWGDSHRSTSTRFFHANERDVDPHRIAHPLIQKAS
jgi:hypothetical protein